MRRINKIIIHCSATPEGREVNAETIDRWHRERGFSMIGYHYVIGLNGQIEEGRPEKMVGAHCKGHNGESIGICYIGGMDKDNKEPKDTKHLPAPANKALVAIVNIARKYAHYDRQHTTRGAAAC